ncbi:MAG TPA: UDP-glucose 4-epimerase GalE [Saprospiraceae bacterium]|nr:UDP-glucose 4-epimerase GalE [Saprospiraceae bacterium]
MKILVTGGAGFIGSHTVVALAETGFTPVLVDDFSNSERLVLDGLEKILGRPVKCYEADCNDRAAMRDIFRREKPAGVIHFAAFKAVGESMAEPLKYYHNNLGSLITLLEVMQESGTTDLIFSSSATVYGQPEQLPVGEDSPPQPAMSVYGNTKRIGEEILRDVAAAGKPFKIISLRYFNPIGAHPSGLIGELPRGVPNNLVPFITQAAAGLRPQLSVFGDDYDTPDGTAVRDYIHVMDLAEAHVMAFQYLSRQSVPSLYDTFNVGTGAGASVMEVIRTFEAASGMSLNYRIAPRRPGDVEAVFADVQKANRELGWTARRSLHDALTDAWRWQIALGAPGSSHDTH